MKKINDLLKQYWPHTVIFSSVLFLIMMGVSPKKKAKKDKDEFKFDLDQHKLQKLLNTAVSDTRSKSWFQHWGRNPFYIEKKAIAQEIIPVLSGILWDDDAPSAVIDGEVVYRGAQVNGYVLLDIHPDKVFLNKGSRIIKLDLESEE